MWELLILLFAIAAIVLSTTLGEIGPSPQPSPSIIVVSFGPYVPVSTSAVARIHGIDMK